MSDPVSAYDGRATELATTPSGWPSRSPCNGSAPRARTCKAPPGAQTVEAQGFDGLALQHFYRTLPWLATIRHELEQELFLQDRDLFSGELDLVFVDTTSVYLYRDGVSDLVRHGYSRDRRPDLPQLVLCVAVDGQGWPVAWDVLPGNTADTAALSLTIARFRERFRIRLATGGRRPRHARQRDLGGAARARQRALRVHPGLSLAPRAGGRPRGARPARALPRGRRQPRGQGGHEEALRRKEGFSLLDMQRGAQERGYRAQGFRIAPEFLDRLQGPS